MIHIEAPLVEINNWLIVKLPKDKSLQLPSRGQVMLKGTINGVELHAPVEPDGNGSHWLHVDTKLQKALDVQAGDVVTLEIEATKDWPEPAIPADVAATLKANPDVQKLWDAVTPMARWEWLRWIGSTKNEATRANRIEVSCSKLRHGERRPCCFNRSMCCVPDVSKNGVLLEPATAAI